MWEQDGIYARSPQELYKAEDISQQERTDENWQANLIQCDEVGGIGVLDLVWALMEGKAKRRKPTSLATVLSIEASSADVGYIMSSVATQRGNVQHRVETWTANQTVDSHENRICDRT